MADDNEGERALIAYRRKYGIAPPPKPRFEDWRTGWLDAKLDTRGAGKPCSEQEAREIAEQCGWSTPTINRSIDEFFKKFVDAARGVK